MPQRIDDPAMSSTEPRRISVVPGVIGALLLLSLFVMPLPLGANRDFLWPPFVALWSLLAAVVVLRAWLRRLPLLPTDRATRWALALAWIFTLAGFAYAFGGTRSGAGPLLFPEAGLAADVPAAELANLRQLGYVLVLTLLVTYCDSVARLQACAVALFAAGVVQALVGTYVKFADVTWFASAAQTLGHRWATGTFVNRNHFAGFLELTGAMGVGLLVGQLGQGTHATWRARLRSVLQLIMGPRAWLRILLAAIVVALVLSQSRMGNLAFFGAMAAAGVCALLWMRPLPRSLVILLLSLMLVDLMVLGSWFGVDQVVERVRDTNVLVGAGGTDGRPAGGDLERAQVAKATVALARAYPWLGTGPGSFRSVFPTVKPADVRLFYDHAHNDWAQLALERGLVGLALWVGMVAIAGWAALRSMRRSDPRLRGLGFGSLMAILALLLHAFVDFNFQIPANAAYFHAVLAIALASAGLATRRRRQSPGLGPGSERRAGM